MDLRDRARFAALDAEARHESWLVDKAAHYVRVVLGEELPDELDEVMLVSNRVDFTIEGLHFRYHWNADELEDTLQVKPGALWKGFESLAELGRILRLQDTADRKTEESQRAQAEIHARAALERTQKQLMPGADS